MNTAKMVVLVISTAMLSAPTKADARGFGNGGHQGGGMQQQRRTPRMVQNRNVPRQRVVQHQRQAPRVQQHQSMRRPMMRQPQHRQPQRIVLHQQGGHQRLPQHHQLSQQKVLQHHQQPHNPSHNLPQKQHHPKHFSSGHPGGGHPGGGHHQNAVNLHPKFHHPQVLHHHPQWAGHYHHNVAKMHQRRHHFFRRFYNLDVEPVAYRDNYDHGFFWWLVNELSQSKRDRWLYHHWNELDPERVATLEENDPGLVDRLAALEEQNGGDRNPDYVPDGLDPDLQYSDDFLSSLGQ